MTDISVVLPVLNGERYLKEVLAALEAEVGAEILVIDSGSRDRSVEIARSAGAEVVEVAPEEFGHGRTRNLGAELTKGELICFLTQDATPVEGWLDAYREAFRVDPRVGAAFGPHLPRPGTSPMIARELTEFFARFSPDGAPVVQHAGDDPFLSNVNACYARECWSEIRFRDIAYAEDQAFGRDVLAAGWTKVYHPSAAVLHSHDYGPIEFMRRYFDEYRGLRETTGHVERLGVRSLLRGVHTEVSADRRWMKENGANGRVARWTARSALHHTSRRLVAALGSRAPHLPKAVQRTISLERRGKSADAPVVVTGPPIGKPVPTQVGIEGYAAAMRVLRDGPVPLQDPVPGMSERDRLHVAIVIPPFKSGAGGMNTINQIVMRIERMGHTCSFWLSDPFDELGRKSASVLRQWLVDHFAPVSAPLFKGFEHWYGADVVMATGWQTVHPAMLLDGCRSRVYLVNDHEPEFYATSVESWLAEQTYSLDLYCIAASPWLRDLLIERYGASSTDFQLGVDHSNYFPRPIERRQDTVIFYARAHTPRRGVEVATEALAELKRHRPDIRVVFFGHDGRVLSPIPYEHIGIVTREELAWAYSEATVGLVLSMTNFSLIPKEMMACGLPCVELAGVSAESIFGEDGPIELADLEPDSLADAMERLLTDPELWQRRSQQGIEFVASHTWDVAAEQVERGFREALRQRESVVMEP